MENEGRIVFRDASGREITVQDLFGSTGSVQWGIVGAEAVPAEARALHEHGRAAGSAGNQTKALALFEQAQALAPQWPYPTYDAAFTCLMKGDAAKALERRPPSCAADRSLPGLRAGRKESASLLTDPEQRLAAIEAGLAADPDAETRTMLLLNKAGLLNQRGDRDTAIAILGSMALDPDATLSAYTLARFVLAQLLGTK